MFMFKMYIICSYYTVEIYPSYMKLKYQKILKHRNYRGLYEECLKNVAVSSKRVLYPFYIPDKNVVMSIDNISNGCCKYHISDFFSRYVI